MNILYITLENLSIHKGSVVHIKEVVAGLKKRGHRVGLIGRASVGLRESDSFYNISASVPFLPIFSGLKKESYLISSVLLFFSLLKLLPHYDVIYARDYHTAIIALLPRLIHRRRLVCEINGLAGEEQRLKGNSKLNRLISFLIEQAEKNAVQCSDRIVSVTPQIAHHVIRHFHCGPDKVKVVNNGVDTEKFHPLNDPDLLQNWRRRLSIGKEETVVAFVGNLARWQGVEYLIRVAPTLTEIIRSVKFLVVGDGPLKDELEGEVTRLGLSNRFIFTGMVDYEDIPIYINLADICLAFKKKLRSGYSPIKLYEYMACGKPVVASRVEGLEFIEEEGTGRLAEPEDAATLCQALLSLLRNPESRVNMGRKGLQVVRRRFDWKMKVAEIDKVLEDVA